MFKVKFSNTGDTAEVEEGSEMIDATRDKGWPIAYGCEDGMCGTCIVKVNEGMENLPEMSEQESQTLEVMGMNDGQHRLACQCKVNGDVTIEGM
ncbi:(2Fe-2S)-binding protein [Candidatus Peregrinibacteria bacterium]|jgi:ferredoxin|nr:(2Fe-2S)-binding protein [Candidatus Peregrinibacteria bacterium]MBT7736776.1 (2Fe-2S)-binding protein [Candidatus Peregrinibacteria bacterium]